MSRIEFFYKPETPVDVSSLTIRIYDRDFSEIINASDNKTIEEVWQRLREEKGDKIFSKPRSLGTLYDARGNILTFRPTEFKVYIATTLSHEQRSLSQQIYDSMRVGAVGVCVRTIDGVTFINRRSPHVTHAKNLIDSSAAGFVPINQSGKLDFSNAVYEKLRRELKITPEEVISLKLTAVHHAYEPDFSGMCDFVVETNLEKGDLERRIDPNSFAEHFFISQRELPAFIIDHYIVRQDMVPDGCATLLSSLNHQASLELIEQLRRLGKSIKFGNLEDNLFIERQI